MADTKKMIHDAYGIQKMQRGGGGGDPVSGQLYGMARSIFAGKVMAAVEGQPRPLGDVLIMCYVPEWEDANFKAIHRALVGEFIKRHGNDVKQDRTFIKLKRLAEVAIFSYQKESRSSAFPIDLVCQMAGIDRSNWYKAGRKWPMWWDAMGRIIHRWHREAMKKPDEVCGEIVALRTLERQQMTAV